MDEQLLQTIKTAMAGKTADEIAAEIAGSVHGATVRDPLKLAAFLVKLAAS